MIALGYIAGLFTSMAFVPQVTRTFRTKKVEDLSWGLTILYWIGILLWLIYGIFFLHDLSMILANSVSLTMSSLLIFAKIKYSK